MPTGTTTQEADGASLHPGGEGPGRPAGAPAESRARHRPRDRAAGRPPARLRRRVGAELGPARPTSTTARRPGRRAEEAERIKALEQENKELKRANEILRRASAFFARRSSTAHRSDRRLHRRATGTSSGSSPSARTLQVAPSTYYAAKKRPPSARAVRDAVMLPILLASVAGQLLGLRRPQALEGRPAGRPRHRPGPGGPAHAPARHPGREPGTPGDHHPAVTTQADRSPDLVKRNFTADGPEPAVGDGPDLCADVVRGGLRVLHRRRLQPDDRRLAGGAAPCAPRWCSTPWRWPAGNGAPSSRA